MPEPENTAFDRAIPVGEAAGRLGQIVGALSAEGLAASPVRVSSPDGEAVIISAAQFAALADRLDALVTGQVVRQRLSDDAPPVQLTVQELAERLGVAVDDRGPGA